MVHRNAPVALGEGVIKHNDGCDECGGRGDGIQVGLNILMMMLLARNVEVQEEKGKPLALRVKEQELFQHLTMQCNSNCNLRLRSLVSEFVETL